MYETINQILIEEDIEGLIEIGAPIDEYEDEAEKIATALIQLGEQKHNADSVCDTCSSVWQKCFELDDEQMALRKHAMQKLTLRVSAQIRA